MDGLIWYLEARNWAFEKIATLPVGSSLLDVRMYYYSYFSNALSAVDLVGDTLGDDGGRKPFLSAIEGHFPTGEDFAYARELRNSIVHRGQDPAWASHTFGNIVLGICPERVTTRSGNKTYTCSFRYLLGLAACLSAASNEEIWKAVTDNPTRFEEPTMSVEQFRAEVQTSTVMPEWAKGMANAFVETLDWQELMAKIADTKVAKLSAALGRAQ